MIGAILNRLDAVNQTREGRFVARCPAHDDRNPSLSLRETDDGRILLHCFAGCEVQSVLDALGLTLADLYPEPLGQHFKRERTRFDARGALDCIYHEVLVVSVLADRMAAGHRLHDDENQRLLLAASRLADAKDGAATLRRVR